MMKDMTVICVQIIRCCHTARQTSLDIKEYKSNPKDCENCPLRGRCTSSKNFQKVVTRHVWEEYREEVMDEIRHTPEWKEIYPRRKESIERVFADCKEHHTLRYTRLRGLQKISISR